MYKIYNENETLYSTNIKHITKVSIFATFQQPYTGQIIFWVPF